VADLIPAIRRHRAFYSIAFDTMAWVLAFLVFSWLRFELSLAQVPWQSVVSVALGTAAAYAVLATATRLHHGRAVTGSTDQVLLLAIAVLSTTSVVFVLNLVAQWVPRSVPVGAGLMTLVMAVWARSTWVHLRTREHNPLDADTAVPCLVVGAGEGGRELVASMRRDPHRSWNPIGLVDDDPFKRHLRLSRVPVIGTTERLSELVAATGAQAIIIAIPSASTELVHRLRRQALQAGVPVKTLPATTQLLADSVGIRDLRDINLTDVLGRNQLDTDIDAIASYLTGRRVLVTGAGGSIGSELCRQIHRFAPAELMMLDRDESALHAVQLSIHGKAMLDSDEVILCDIRDAEAVQAIFHARRPEVVFHAAALKHLPMLEQYPAEAVKTNIVGTTNVLDAAEAVSVDKFVNISTDKAANPESVLGYTKRVSERLTAARAEATQGDYLSVRFGNVLGSRGSVLTAFAKQIAAGGPVTVTDPEVTRYFMTIEEACQLVVQAAAIGRPGEALVLDMGQPVRIADMARQLIDQDGAPIDIVFTGLRPGEKLHEDLFSDFEPQNDRPAHPMVSHVPVPPILRSEAHGLLLAHSGDEVRESLADLCALEGFLVG
jgi:FlaA1/EpsC-like NDP-sugar epimerase